MSGNNWKKGTGNPTGRLRGLSYGLCIIDEVHDWWQDGRCIHEKLGKERSRMPGGFDVREPIFAQEGIPVHGNGDPVERTYVVAKDLALFHRFCNNSKLNPCSASVKWVPAHSRSQGPGCESSIGTDDKEWKQVAFVGVNPSLYGELSGPDWYVLENRRSNRQFTRAWYFSHLLVTPNLVDPPSEDEMFSQWESDL